MISSYFRTATVALEIKLLILKLLLHIYVYLKKIQLTTEITGTHTIIKMRIRIINLKLSNKRELRTKRETRRTN